jgi:hypothetical protein
MSERKPCIVGKCKKGVKYGNLPIILVIIGIIVAVVGFIIGFTNTTILIFLSIVIFAPTEIGTLGWIIGFSGVAILVIGLILNYLSRETA